MVQIENLEKDDVSPSKGRTTIPASSEVEVTPLTAALNCTAFNPIQKITDRRYDNSGKNQNPKGGNMHPEQDVVS